MKEINNNTELNEILNENKPIILDFYADWCGPCQALLPTLESIDEKYRDTVQVVKINVDKNQDISADFKVRSIPSLFFIQDGKIVSHLNGLHSETTIENKISEFKIPMEI